MQDPKDNKGGSRDITVVSDPESRPIPSGAQIGALNLAWNGFELTSNGTAGPTKESARRELLPTPKSLAPEAFGSEWHPLAPIAAAPRMAKRKVHPTGLEPVTFGSVGRSLPLEFSRLKCLLHKDFGKSSTLSPLSKSPVF
jgi:hypothetical protein